MKSLTLQLTFQEGKAEYYQILIIKKDTVFMWIFFNPSTPFIGSFTSYPISMYKDKVDSYVDSVIKEIKFLGEQLKGRELNTVYIGGGTPTTLNLIRWIG